MAPTSLLSQMKPLPDFDPACLPAADLAVSLIIPARNSAHSLETTVQAAHDYLKSRNPGGFEVILVPNPDGEDGSEAIARALAARLPEVRVFPHASPVGKGAALRTGFVGSRGKWIFFTDADLPYDLDFFDAAAVQLSAGYSWITGNRRLPSSHFDVPVSLLRLAYGRHRLGLWFNRVVRWLLPVTTTDTQAGIKAMTREFATRAFALQTCPGFFFDLEFFLAAVGRGEHHLELPVTLYLNSEKSTVRVLRESVLAAYWLLRISLRYRRGRYGSKLVRRVRVLPRYRGAGLATRLFLLARWRLTPYLRMTSRLPPHGAILDLGSGHGLLSLAAALQSDKRRVFGIDHDTARVVLATEAARGLANVEFAQGDMLNPPAATHYSGITMIDVMHYFEPGMQEKLVRNAFSLLEKGGTLLVREVDTQGGAASSWNRLYEKIATGIGFTQSSEKNMYFRSPDQWARLFESAGFAVSSERCSAPVFADILYVCKRP